MQNPNERVQAIQSKLVTLKSMASQLDRTLVDKTAKEFLLRPAANTLSDMERPQSFGGHCSRMHSWRISQGVKDTNVPVPGIGSVASAR